MPSGDPGSAGGDGLVRVGRIVKPHGVQGELVVEVHTEFPGRQFAPGCRLNVEGTGELPRLTVVEARPHQQRLLLETEEITGRGEAEDLRNRWLLARPVDAGEERSGYGAHELTGLRVEDQRGRTLGTVEAVRHLDTNPVLEIAGDDGTLDYPAHEDLIESISLDEGVLRLRLPRGWRKLMRKSEGSP